jgi:hypothetical protein
MKAMKLWCECGMSFGLTRIQFDDFQVGICGMLTCVKCKKVLLPMVEEINCLAEEIEIKGKDPGWSVCEWEKRIKDIMEAFGDAVLVAPDGVI